MAASDYVFEEPIDAKRTWIRTLLCFLSAGQNQFRPNFFSGVIYAGLSVVALNYIGGILKHA